MRYKIGSWIGNWYLFSVQPCLLRCCNYGHECTCATCRRQVTTHLLNHGCSVLLWHTDFVEPIIFVVNVYDTIQKTVIWGPLCRSFPMFHWLQYTIQHVVPFAMKSFQVGMTCHSMSSDASHRNNVVPTWQQCFAFLSPVVKFRALYTQDTLYIQSQSSIHLHPVPSVMPTDVCVWTDTDHPPCCLMVLDSLPLLNAYKAPNNCLIW
jgi:hypothetical protein